jgi:hypothetical protein
MKEARPNAVDTRRLVTHDTMVIGTDVVYADVVTPDNQDIGFILGCGCRRKNQRQNKACCPDKRFHLSLLTSAHLSRAV